MPKADSRTLAALSIGLIVIAANLGLVARLYFQGDGGQVLFVATRVWILALPLIWVWRIERKRFSFTWPTRRALRAGMLLGLGMAAVIYSAYELAGQGWIDPTYIRARAAATGLQNPLLFLAFAIYFTFINAFVEEYVWRWFVYRQGEVLLPGFGAVILAAGCFTLHHIVALWGYTGNGWITLIGTVGVFVAGTIWSGCYLVYRSLWVCYISHLWADLAIAIVGWQILFV